MSIHVITGNITAAELPSGYTQVEYIESTGTQYIDTGISVPCNSEKVIIEFAPMEDNTANDNPLAGHAAPAWSWDSNLSFVLNERLWTANTGYGFAEIKTGTFYKVEYTSSYCKVNDGTVLDLAARTYTDGYNNTLCYASTKYGKQRIKSYKLYNGSTLVRDLVPCINPSGKVGAYDLVSKGFFGNSGTGEFIASPTNIPHEVVEVSVIDGGTIRDFKSGYVIENGTIYQVFGGEPCKINYSARIKWSTTNYTLGPPAYGLVIKSPSGNVKTAWIHVSHQSNYGKVDIPSMYNWTEYNSKNEVVSITLDADIGDTLEIWVNAYSQNDDYSSKGGSIRFVLNDEIVATMSATSTDSDTTYTGDEEYVYHSITITGNVSISVTGAGTDTSVGAKADVHIKMEG